MPRIKNNQKGVILLLTLFILSSILVVTLGAADLVFAGIKMNRLTGYSNLAFFASEAGLERALWEARTWEARKVPNPLLAGGKDDFFSCADNPPSCTLANGSSYIVKYTPNVTFKSIGIYSGAKRSVESTYQAQ